MFRFSRALVTSTLFVAAAISTSASAANQVTFNLTVPLQNVFIYGYEFNGKVYAWDLFPYHIGNVPAGVTTYAVGGVNPTTWAIVGTSGGVDVAMSVNDSIDPPTGLPFATVFSGYDQSVVRSEIVGLWNGGYNSQAAFALFSFVLDNEDPLKTDGVQATIDMYTFSNGIKRGTATFGPVAACPADINASGGVDAADLSLLLGSWGTAGAGDINHDGATDGTDLSILLGAWGVCP